MPIFRINDKNILFMHIPKAGGTSIEQWLGGHGQRLFHLPRKRDDLPCVPQHFHAELIESLFGSRFFDYSFAVVRNPYWRLLSEYNFRMSHRPRRERIFPVPSFDRWLCKVLRRYRSNPYIYSNHIRPQVDFMVEGVEAFSLETDLPKLRHTLAALCQVDAPSEIPVTNRSIIRETRISETAARLVYEFYREDFERFGYPQDSYGDRPARLQI